MKNFVLGVITTLIILAIAGFAYLELGLAEVRADVAPSAVESSLMRRALRASVRRHAPEVSNPVPPSDENLIAGAKIYLGECAGCHGTPGVSHKEPESLFPPAPRLSEAGTEFSEAQIFWVAKHGIRRTGMFANGVWSDDQKLWTVTAFIKRIHSLPPAVSAEVEKTVNKK
jgi:mono/diheme cytochrome c family protein